MRRLLPLLLSPLLGACGLVPLPEVQAQDFYFVNTVPNLQPHEVAYMDTNQLDHLTLPRARYRHVTLDAVLTPEGPVTEARVQIFASATRPSCPVVPPLIDWPTGDALRCDGPAGGQQLTEVTLGRGTDTPIHLEGAALDEAIRGGQLYIGVRLLSREDTQGAVVWVRQIRVRARV
ncbi:hypothetical protein [Deinococcus multiflagellatus]|uniref:Lipoprotein n=1 Tax=Deinococcus multiflagellatus TaxID=1656887 RepID=A0ABW1ZN83_9DEIO|nr:hypothetical protein [Deinococcus multiflagellatus]MBZ9714193.1 hypothetical protein [Deinococcus multiflagellatus]